MADLLNFINRAVYPGRAFTRCMYAKFAGLSIKVSNLQKHDSSKALSLKQHHHVRIDGEFRRDCEVWISFLECGSTAVCRPFINLNNSLHANTLDFYTDASKGIRCGGFGGIFGRYWINGKWNPSFIKEQDPSIEYLELFGVCIAYFAWAHLLKNQRIILFCDNQSVVNMINNSSSSCRNCMVLIRKMTLKSLINNTPVFAKWVMGSKNVLADCLSHQKFNKFYLVAKGRNMCQKPTSLPEELWPVEKIWLKK